MQIRASTFSPGCCIVSIVSTEYNRGVAIPSRIPVGVKVLADLGAIKIMIMQKKKHQRVSDRVTIKREYIHLFKKSSGDHALLVPSKWLYSKFGNKKSRRCNDTARSCCYNMVNMWAPGKAVRRGGMNPSVGSGRPLSDRMMSRCYFQSGVNAKAIGERSLVRRAKRINFFYPNGRVKL
jgi:hypothetical protein